ncbi:MAG: M3 family metallopeptidase [Candidatus Pacearchaeota archaeon]|nr:M3 family metallopeptidase [Candidatus Pacearchaeota archaeon]
MKDEIQEFLDEQTSAIKPLYKKLQLSYWNASTTGKKEEYDEYETCQKELAKFFNNPKNFDKVKKFMQSGQRGNVIKRQLRALYNSYLGNQGDLKLINQILEKSTAIEQKFNTFRARVNGKEVSDNEIKEILKKETDSEKLQGAWEASKKQGELVASELIELINLRNKLAKSLGFANYYELSLEANEQNKQEIFELFEELYKLTKKSFNKIKSEIDSFLKKRYKTVDLKPWHYQNLFFQEAPEIYEINLDKLYESDILQKAEKFYSALGLDVSGIISRSDLYERKGKYQHAYCIDLDRGGDIRSIMNIKNNEHWMDTVLHELGHGVYWEYIDKKLPFLIRDVPHTLTTEAIAQFFGRNSENASFIKRYCKIDSLKLEKLSEKIEKSLQMRELVFSRWCQVMVNFEYQLYKNPNQDLNKLWWGIVKKYQLIDFSRDRADWASKIHLVSSPVYYHNYIIGELFASQLNNFIANKILNMKNTKNLDYSASKKVGGYLKERVFFPGALYPWKELIEFSTGEKLTSKYWVGEFCRYKLLRDRY